MFFFVNIFRVPLRINFGLLANPIDGCVDWLSLRNGRSSIFVAISELRLVKILLGVSARVCVILWTRNKGIKTVPFSVPILCEPFQKPHYAFHALLHNVFNMHPKSAKCFLSFPHQDKL